MLKFIILRSIFKCLDPKNILLRNIFCPKTLSFGNILGGGGKLGQFGGEVELFGGEVSPAPPSLDETLKMFLYSYACYLDNTYAYGYYVTMSIACHYINTISLRLI